MKLMMVTVMVILSHCSYLNSSGKITVINKSDEVVTYVKIEICRQVMQFKMLQINSSTESVFKINGDSHYSVIIEFASGRQLEKEMGYVTNGICVEDIIIITNDTIFLDRNAVNCP